MSELSQPSDKKQNKIGWGVMTFLALAITLLVLGRYGSANPDNFFPQQRLVYMAHITAIMTHIFGSSVALLLGPFQFLPRLRQNKGRSWHRWLGRIYLVGVLLGGSSGFYMARLAHGGLLAQLGFGALATVWLATAVMAYHRIRQRNIKAHQRWMIRNFALTFAAVTLRLYLFLFAVFTPSVPFTTSYIIVAWLAWVPNLLFAEWLLARRGLRHHRLGRQLIFRQS